jgi:hypothetical protein
MGTAAIELGTVSVLGYYAKLHTTGAGSSLVLTMSRARAQRHQCYENKTH